jgi:hypothetical protein
VQYTVTLLTFLSGIDDKIGWQRVNKRLELTSLILPKSAWRITANMKIPWETGGVKKEMIILGG